MTGPRPEEKHTPEPWSFSNGVLIRVSNTKSLPTTICGVHRIGSQGGNGLGDPLANARRIVACVNACAGISTKDLEEGAVKELREALKQMTLLFRSALLLTSPEIAKEGMEFVRHAEAALAKAGTT